MRNTIYSCFVAVVTGLGVWGAAPVQAATCGGTYTVQRGDTLYRIANELYENSALWSVIHTDNLSVIGESPNAIRVGMRLTVKCINGLPVVQEGGGFATAADAGTASAPQPGTVAGGQKINLVTASDYAPFTGQKLSNGGLLTEVVTAAMTEADPANGFAIHWVEGRASHLDPLLSNALMDMGFPWESPECAATPDAGLCADFLFSEPMFEALLVLFTTKDAPLDFAKDNGVRGKTLCRPAGYSLHQLDGPERRWLSDALIVFKQPAKVKDCFTMLVAGEVDGVVVNEFTGRVAIGELGLSAQIEMAPRPVAIEALHLVIHKTHPQAQALLATFNSGLRAIQQDGTFQQIVDAHLTRLWAEY